MAAENKTIWTAVTLFAAVHQFYQQHKQKQVQLCTWPDHTSASWCVNWHTARQFDEKYPHHQYPDNAKQRILGETIFKLSRTNEYDRIVELQLAESPDLSQLLVPLLSDEFCSLVSITKLGDRVGRGHHFGGIQHTSTYTALCDLIAKDKVIAVVLGVSTFSHPAEIYDFKKEKFLVDPCKLTDALKTTNTLKEIILPPKSPWEGEPCDFAFERLLRDSLPMNFSVIAITAAANYGADLKIEQNSVVVPDTRCTIAPDVLRKYQQWWPQLQRRNTEAQSFNRILFGDDKEEGTWNNKKCPYQIGLKVIETHFPSIPSVIFDKKGDRCFCIKCHTTRKDKYIYARGKPKRRYALPVEWVRYGLKTDEAKCIMNNVWTDWHVAFHGTPKEVVPLIFRAGLVLLKPGDHTISGDQLGIRGGHIKKAFKRYNQYTKQKETFDPNQIYVSPSIKYSGHGVYAKAFYCSHPEDRNRTIKVQFAFQLRIRPGSYQIGQETVGAAQHGKKLDEHFDNNELEWYTKENIGIVLHGLLLRIKEINVPFKKYQKEKAIADDIDDEKKDDK